MNVPIDVKAVVIACRDGRLALSGGGVVRLDPQTPCPPNAAGRTFAISFDADGIVVRLRPPNRGETLAEPSKIPSTAYLSPPREPAKDASEQVSCVIDVYVPPRTPPTDDIYISTERSNWNAAEIRLNRVDPRHYTTTIVLPRGTILPFRISRGSLATGERDAAQTIPPPHILRAQANTELRIDVAGWADIS